MKAAKTLAKTFTVAMGVMSLVAMAESYYDSKFYTADFMDSVAEVKVNIPRAKVDNRVVASKQKKLPLVQRVDLSNSELVNGEWIITKVVDDKEQIAYDSSREIDGEHVVVKLELIDTSIVRIDDDFGQTFKISLLTREGTIALFKEFGEGYEIVQAIRVRSNDLLANKKVKKPIQEVKENKNAQKYHIEEDLLLVSALDPQKNRNVLRADNLEGYAYLRNGELIMESVRLHVGTNKQTESLSTEARVKDHGVFNDERGNQGIVTNVNNDEVKVRFSTGPLAGAMLNFVTEQKKMEIEEKFGTSTQTPVRAAAETQAPQNPYPEDSYKDNYQEEGQDNDYYQDEVKEEAREQVNDQVEEEPVEDQYYDEGEYQEVEGDRENDSDLMQIDEYEVEKFQDLRNQAPRYSDRDPASVTKTGFSF